MKVFLLLIALALVCLAAGGLAMTPMGHRVMVKLRGERTVEQRLTEVGPAARRRWAPLFSEARIAYPPEELTLVGVKKDRELLVYANGRFVRRIAVLGQSGTLGPKTRQGDNQVPEGVYRIESLNPNSRFHLALRVGYPNATDCARAASQGRSVKSLGGDIMIHGGRASVGCLAVGDEAAEDLFVLAADVGLANVQVLLTPVDFRREEHESSDDLTQGAYGQLGMALTELPLPDPTQ